MFPLLKFLKTIPTQSNFAPAFLFLSSGKRKALFQVYQFAQFLDHLTDQDGSFSTELKLEIIVWLSDFLKVSPSLLNLPNENFGFPKTWPAFLQEECAKQLSQVIEVSKNFQIPSRYWIDLLQGMHWDLSKRNIVSWADLNRYCYYVAGTIGKISILIFGFKNPRTKIFAVYWGIGMQLTNILRDIVEDEKLGRRYLPQKEWQHCHLPAKFGEACVNRNFFLLMHSLANKADFFYEKALTFLSEEDRRTMLPALVMGQTYRTILEKIKSNYLESLQQKTKLAPVDFLKAIGSSLTQVSWSYEVKKISSTLNLKVKSQPGIRNVNLG